MSNSSSRRVTQLLEEISRGNRRAADELLPVVYGELRRLARWRLERETPGQTLQPTALVHEAYLRLVEEPEMGWENRAHFFAAAAEAMKRILIERARRYAREKHGGGRQRVTLREDAVWEEAPHEELLDLDRALEKLEARDQAMSNVVNLRYFAGLSVEETAKALDVAPRTVNRLWTAARAWLYREMTRGGSPDLSP